MKNAEYCLTLIAGMALCIGCASWLPPGEEPAPIKRGLTPAGPPDDVAGVETILVRLDSMQSERLPELWAQVDEQVLSPQLRYALDKNGMRAGKLAGRVPPLLDEWIRATVRRLGEDPLEQAGFAADVSSYSQLWRCREGSRKELLVRNFPSQGVCVFFHDGSTKGKTYDSPQFLYSIYAAPLGDTSAKIRLTPEVQYGDPIRKVITRDSAIRTDMRREVVVWEQLMIDLRIQRGDFIVIGPTRESRGLGEHFLRTKVQNGDIQPVLMIVRLSESNLDDTFAKH
ncbi:MAG: hypothetical protein ABL921_16330 [Pirellula sp.]